MDNLALSDWDEIEAIHFPKRAGTAGSANRSSEVVYAGRDSAARKLLPEIGPIPSESERKRREFEEQRQHRLELIQKYKQKERSVSRKRLKESMLVIIAVAIVSGMFGTVLFRQAQIACLNFQNNETQKKIDTIRQETAQIRESLILGTDLDMVRREAYERLGMQKPGTRQIVSVSVTEGDTLVTRNSFNSIEVSPAALAQAKEDLAEYFSNNS